VVDSINEQVMEYQK